MKYFGQSTFAFVDKSVVNYRKVEFWVKFAKGSTCVWITLQHWFQSSLWNNYWMNNEYILVLNQANIFYKKQRLFWIHFTPQFHVVCVQFLKGHTSLWTTSQHCWNRQKHFIESKGSIILYSMVFYCIAGYFMCSMVVFSIIGCYMTLHCSDGISIVLYSIL